MPPVFLANNRLRVFLPDDGGPSIITALATKKKLFKILTHILIYCDSTNNRHLFLKSQSKTEVARLVCTKLAGSKVALKFQKI